MSEKKIAIQGVEGCYHDSAARRFFSDDDIQIVEFDTFPGMVAAIDADPSLQGIMAIENTIAGSLLQNLELIHTHNIRIVGEHKMRISHSLAALPGQEISDIKEVNSHPMALMQCEEFLQSHPTMKIIEKADTAGSAKEIAEKNLMGHAAVCSEYAASIYGLNVLASGIETNSHNFTRFLILKPFSSTGISDYEDSDSDKASIVFTLPHNQGALSKVLTILAFYDLNLTKIQSFPILGHEWEYKFYVDLTFNDYSRYRQALEAAKPLTSRFKILGEYQECKIKI